MTSIRVKYRPSAGNGHEGKIYFQIIHERVVRQCSSGYKLFDNEWDCRNSTVIVQCQSERKDYLMSIRERIRHDVERFKRIISTLSSGITGFTSDDIVNEFCRQQQQQSFFNFMESIIIRLKKLGRLRTSETYVSALNSFKRFRANDDVLFDGFNSDLMEAYEAYLAGRGLIPNSISFYMRILRATYNRAINSGITDDRQPFRHVYTGIDKTIKRAVDIRAIRQIKKADLRVIPKAEFARDMFLLSFYFRGMSFIDMAYLQKSDLRYGKLTYRRRKTGQQLSICWTNEMQKILDRYPENKTEYLLPIITSATATPFYQYRSKQYHVNKWLKVVAKNAGLKFPLTMYCSRHSWASIAKAEGIPIGVISDGLGHDNELTTQIYLSTLDTSAVDKANARILKLL